MGAAIWETRARAALAQSGNLSFSRAKAGPELASVVWAGVGVGGVLGEHRADEAVQRIAVPGVNGFAPPAGQTAEDLGNPVRGARRLSSLPHRRHPRG